MITNYRKVVKWYHCCSQWDCFLVETNVMNNSFMITFKALLTGLEKKLCWLHWVCIGFIHIGLKFIDKQWPEANAVNYIYRFWYQDYSGFKSKLKNPTFLFSERVYVTVLLPFSQVFNRIHYWSYLRLKFWWWVGL